MVKGPPFTPNLPHDVVRPLGHNHSTEDPCLRNISWLFRLATWLLKWPLSRIRLPHRSMPHNPPWRKQVHSTQLGTLYIASTQSWRRPVFRIFILGSSPGSKPGTSSLRQRVATEETSRIHAFVYLSQIWHMIGKAHISLVIKWLIAYAPEIQVEQGLARRKANVLLTEVVRPRLLPLAPRGNNWPS